ncbi:MAG: hypothetical protein BMS9Abin05_0997 [Rhodothermia bacterium]|nr:MAG: hypothetical protein BMS9Abin05_0997 [Rhodothermia bacterium]
MLHEHPISRVLGGFFSVYQKRLRAASIGTVSRSTIRVGERQQPNERALPSTQVTTLFSKRLLFQTGNLAE